MELEALPVRQSGRGRLQRGRMRADTDAVSDLDAGFVNETDDPDYSCNNGGPAQCLKM